MTTNVGQLDRAIRIVLGLIILAAPFTTELALWQSGWAMGLAVAVGLILLATGLMRTCPAYSLLGINTCPTRHS